MRATQFLCQLRVLGRSNGHIPLAIFLVFLVYVVTAKLGLASAVVHPSATTIWPPTGIALAALIVFGYTLWPGIFLGAFFANITTAGSMWTSFAIAAGNTVEAIAGAYLVNRFAAGRCAFDRPQDVLKFAGLAGLASTVVSPTIGVTSLSLAGFSDFAAYDEIWFTWWLGDVGGALIIAPLLILWGSNPRFSLTRQELWERCIALTLLAAAGYLAFATFPAEDLRTSSVAFLIIPILLCAAVRFGQKEAAAAVFVASAIAIWGTLNGYGPFVRDDPNASLLLLQEFGAILALMVLMLSAAIYNRNRIEAALRNSEETARDRFAELQTIYRNAPVGLGLTDRNLRFLSVNETLAEIDGISVLDHIGRSIREVLPEPLADSLEPLYRRVIDTGEAVVNVEVKGETKANPGVARIWSVNYHPVRDGVGAIMGVSIMVQEITERKRVEEALRHNEQKLSTIIAAADVGTWEWNIQEGTVEVNDRFCTMLGYGPGSFGNDVRRFFDSVHPDDLERLNHHMEAHFSGENELYHCDFRLRKADGTYKWIQDAGRLIERDSAGRPLRMAGIHIDISEQKRAEEALREADRRKDEFLAMLGHELRNPLGIISNGVQILRRVAPPDPQLGDIREMIERQVIHTSRMLDDLLDVSRISRGKIQLNKQAWELRDIVRQTADDYQSMFDDNRLRLELNITQQPLPVVGDRTRLSQVVGNLLHNACKFTQPGGTVRIKLEAENQASSILRVSDDGMGMETNVLGWIFEPFSQAAPSLERSQGGLGLGLALVKAIVELHGGDVKAASDGPGHGSEFIIRLPLEPTYAEAHRAPRSRRL